MSPTLIVFLVRCWMVVWLPLVSLGVLVAVNLWWEPPWPIPRIVILAPAVANGMAVPVVIWREWRPYPWRWRLCRRVAGFGTARRGRVWFLISAGLAGSVDLLQLVRWAESDLDLLAHIFKDTILSPLIVILVPSRSEVAAVFGRPMGGLALNDADTVILTADCPVREVLRHELVHLFAARWNRWAPPLLAEGLAVFLQGTQHGRRVHDEAGDLIPFHEADIHRLLDPSGFFAEEHRHACYTLAGGFTGFLIRRFGWDGYRDLYRNANHRTFRYRFQKQFGLALEDAWRHWHDEARAMDVLNRRLDEDRLFH